MPEIAEVKLLIDGFANVLSQLNNIKINGDNGQKFINAGRFQGYHKIRPDVSYRITNHGARGKLAFLALKIIDSDSDSNPNEDEVDYYLTFHFGMSGNFRYSPPDDADKKHYLVQFIGQMSSGVQAELWYHDIRRFGRMAFLEPAEFKEKLNKLAPDLLSDAKIENSEIVKRFRKYNKWNICKLMMNQEKAFSGIGNYMSSEILYRVRISPFRTIDDLNDEQLIKVYEEGRKLASLAYDSGGASLYTYTGFKGDRSDFKDSLEVYNRTSDPIGRVVTRIPAEESPDKRTKFVCWDIQI